MNKVGCAHVLWAYPRVFFKFLEIISRIARSPPLSKSSVSRGDSNLSQSGGLKQESFNRE